MEAERSARPTSAFPAPQSGTKNLTLDEVVTEPWAHGFVLAPRARPATPHAARARAGEPPSGHIRAGLKRAGDRGGNPIGAGGPGRYDRPYSRSHEQ